MHVFLKTAISINWAFKNHSSPDTALENHLDKSFIMVQFFKKLNQDEHVFLQFWSFINKCNTLPHQAKVKSTTKQPNN